MWVINPENNLKNKVVFDNKTKLYSVDQFLIASKGQKIEFQGTMQDTISKDFKFNFQNVKLSNITPDVDSLKLRGIINGTLNYNQFKKRLKPTANLTVSDFNINNSFQGDLKVGIEGKNSMTEYALDISLKRDNSIN